MGHWEYRGLMGEVVRRIETNRGECGVLEVVREKWSGMC